MIHEKTTDYWTVKHSHTCITLQYSLYACPHSGSCYSVVAVCCCLSYLIFNYCVVVNQAVGCPFNFKNFKVNKITD